MSKINRKDIESFGKVLEALGIALQKNPDMLAALIKDVDPNTKDVNEEDVNIEKLSQIPLFQLAKNSPEKLEETLIELTTPELKNLLKLNHLGGSNFKARDSIIKYILDQLKKRTTDVFREHNSENEMSASIEIRNSSTLTETDK